MHLSDRDRKLLWGRAANRCAYCQRALVVDATVADRESIVGDEAHIVSDSSDGPRGQAMDRSNLDSYENAILLCKVHHKMVDDQPHEFTSEVLRRMKANHEKWVTSTLSEAEWAAAKKVATGVAELQHADDDARRRLLSRFAPSDWCAQGNVNGVEVVLRCAIALPEPVQLGAAAHENDQVTRLRAEAREDLIVKVLNAAELTTRVRALRSAWHWSGEGGWQALGGSGNPELTRLAFQFNWPEHRIRQPVALTSAVLTGLTNNVDQAAGARHGLVLAIDLSLNVLELDGDRRPSPVAHRTTPAPAPAALTLAELGDLMCTLLTVPDVGLSLVNDLLHQTPTDGHVAIWLALNGVELDRVINLETLDRLTGGLLVTRWEKHSPWPLIDSPDDGTGIRAFFAGFLEELLEHSDYRRFQAAVAEAINNR